MGATKVNTQHQTSVSKLLGAAIFCLSSALLSSKFLMAKCGDSAMDFRLRGSVGSDDGGLRELAGDLLTEVEDPAHRQSPDLQSLLAAEQQDKELSDVEPSDAAKVEADADDAEGSSLSDNDEGELEQKKPKKQSNEGEGDVASSATSSDSEDEKSAAQSSDNNEKNEEFPPPEELTEDQIVRLSAVTAAAEAAEAQGRSRWRYLPPAALATAFAAALAAVYQMFAPN